MERRPHRAVGLRRRQRRLAARAPVVSAYTASIKSHVAPAPCIKTIVESPLKRPAFALKAVESLTTLAAVILLACVLAHWTWVWLAPRPEMRAQAMASFDSHSAAAGDLFGKARADGERVTPTGISIRLLGIAASGKQHGYAVVELEPRRIVAVREGDELMPGIRLARVETDHVVLERNGTRETLAWPQKGQTLQRPEPPAARSERTRD
jgi:general secretion pathway protein C